MPAIQPGAKVLVSGANGFIAVWLVQTLSEKGYAVRGTVRSASKGEHLNKLFAEKYGKKFELAVVEDITKEGAFDEAVKDVDAIAHTASPFNYAAITSPEGTIKPAVDGTIGVLESALKNGNSTIKRIVVTSSVAAALLIRTQYISAAWDFHNDNKAAISWDLATLNPPWVLGPVLHEVSCAADLGQSAGDWYNAVLKSDSNGLTNEQLATQPPGSWIDVRDLASAHVLALEKPAAGGERFVVTAGTFVFQDFLDVVNSVAPTIVELPADRVLPKGVLGAGKTFTHPVVFDPSKAKRILGLTYRSKEKTAFDALKDALRRGW